MEGTKCGEKYCSTMFPGINVSFTQLYAYTMTSTGNGDQEWYRDGKLHRDGDLPAVVAADGAVQEWFKYGKRHRDGDLPAAVDADNYQTWYQDGTRHRDGDLPAIVRANGDQEWYKDGKRHRDGDLPAFLSQGYQAWFRDGKYHRDIGPAWYGWTNHVFYEHGVKRQVKASLGETLVNFSLTSWSPVLCFM